MKIGMLKKLQLRCVFALCCCAISFSSLVAQNGTKRCKTTTYSLRYSPEKFQEINVLPEYIQRSLSEHLTQKLGAALAEKIHFDGGEIINYKQLVQADPQVKQYKWVAPKYDLRYVLSDTCSAIRYCCSRIVLDSLGNIIVDTEFPALSKNKYNSIFISNEKLIEIARKLGLQTASYGLGIAKNHIVFIFSLKKNNTTMTFTEISVHTGEIIRKYKGSVN